MIQVGDRVLFREPGFVLTGMGGKVEGARPFALLVLFDNGSVQTWRRDYFEKEQDRDAEREQRDDLVRQSEW